jgi:hypothetical protein
MLQFEGAAQQIGAWRRAMGTFDDIGLDEIGDPDLVLDRVAGASGGGE